MTAEQLAIELDKAKMVRYDPDNQFVIAWFGGHGIHAYSLDGEEVHFSNIGSFVDSDVTPREVAEEMERMIRENEY